MSLARAGHFDAAMAGAIGSQVFYTVSVTIALKFFAFLQVINITIGVGLPLLLLGLFDGKGVAIKHEASA